MVKRSIAIMCIFLPLMFSCYLGSSQIQVQGKVSNEKNQPMVGVDVVVKGTTNGTVTDDIGNYKLNVPNKNSVLEFTFQGYTAQTIPVNGRIQIDVRLEPFFQSLDKLVVVGYMTQKKADLTGAISVVSSSDIAESHGVTNVLTAIQGKVPGMYITADGSPAGNATSVQIRGMTSVNGAPPLVVIDGVPYPKFNFRDLNPNNIESMQVLKDAYSASIYGAQGAGGVILIQTKQGKSGKLTLNYNNSIGFSTWMNKPALMNTQQYGQALWQAAINSGLDPNNATQIYTFDWHNNTQGIPILDKVTPIKQFNDTMFAANTNWLDAITHMGIQTDHQITLSGGTDKSNTLLSLEYFKNDGFIIYTGYERYSARINTNYKLLKGHFEIGENLEVSRLNMDGEPYNADVHYAMTMPSIVPVHTLNGGWGGSAIGLGMDDYWNPVRELTLNKDNRNKYNKVIGDVHANVYFLKHFTLHSQIGLIYTEGTHRTINFSFREGGGKVNASPASVDQWYMWNANFDWTNTLEYKITRGKSNIDALIGTEATKFTTEFMDGNRQGIQFENYNYAFLGTANGNTTVNGGGDEYAFLSYFGKVNYVYDSKYLLSGSLRRDGSSKFGVNNQYGLFSAISGGWRVSSENFMQSMPYVSDLKLRVSYGTNGNSNIPTGATETLFGSNYNVTSYAIAGNPTGNNPSGFFRLSTGNPNLKWESSRQVNIGLDFGFFSQSLTGSLDFYRKTTKGMLFQPPYLGAIGEGGYQWVNAADMSDKGVELEVTYHNNTSRDFHWEISGNISHNTNRITNLPTAVEFAYGGSPFKGDNIDGHPFHSWYGFVVPGIFKTQDQVDNSPSQPGKGLGRLQYEDLSGPNGKPDGVIDFNYDQTWLGSWDPTVTFGLNFSATYKALDFNMFWQGVLGNTVFDEFKTYSDFYNVYVQNGFNHPVRILDAWSQTNPNSNIPSMAMVNVNDELRMSSYLLASGDYLKLRNIQIGYTIPSEVLSKISIQKFRVFVMAQNLITIKKWWGKNAYIGPDPETQVGPGSSNYNDAYVIPTIFKAGLDVTF